MCKPKPGLRCSSHAKAKLARAQSDHEKAILTQKIELMAASYAELEKAKFEFWLTPQGIKELKESNPDRAAKMSRIAEERKRVDKRLQDAYQRDSDIMRKHYELRDGMIRRTAEHDFGKSSREDYESALDIVNADMETVSAEMERSKDKDSFYRDRITEQLNSGASVPEDLLVSSSFESMSLKLYEEHLKSLKSAKAKYEHGISLHIPDRDNSGKLAEVHPENLVGVLEPVRSYRGHVDYWLKDDAGERVAFVRTYPHAGREGYLNGEPYVTLGDIEVRDGHRGRGYARAIIEQVQNQLGQRLYATGTYTSAGAQRCSHLLPMLPGSQRSPASDCTFVHDWESRQPKYV